MFCQVQPAAKQRKPVISVDYESMVAIKTSEGLEEKKKLKSGPGGVCHCTWDDGTVYASDVPALFLTMPRAPILAMKVSKKKKEKKVSLKRPSAAEALAAKRIKAAADEDEEDEDEEDEGGEEEEQSEPDSELEETESTEEKAKPGGEEEEHCVDPRHIKGKPVGLVQPTSISMRQVLMCP